MSPETAKLNFITCPNCKSQQYFLYPHTKKICAEPTCAKEFDIVYTAELLRQIVDEILKNLQSEASKDTGVISVPLKPFFLKNHAGGSFVTWH